MRRFIAIPLLVLYITAISGMMIQLHYCGSKLSSWKVNATHAQCCCKPSGKDADNTAQQTAKIKNQDDDCCQNKTITLKIKQDQNRASEIQYQLASLQLTAPVLHVAIPAFVLSEEDAYTSYQANAPPGRWQQIPLYLLHGSFTYYG